MKKFLLASAVLALLGASVTMSVMAQPPREERPPGGDRPEGPPPEGKRRDGEQGEAGRPPMPNPLVAALDTNGDRQISAEELQAATASLLTLDKNSDGKLTDDEMRPPRPDGGGREGGPREGAGREGAGREGGPRDGGREGAPRDGAGRGEGPQGRGQGSGQGPEGGPMGPPNPERLVEHAMHFDADGDGKLDKSEMMKFAQEFTSRMGRPGGPGGEGGPGGGRPGGPGPQGGGPEGERPRRPAAE